MNNFNIILIEDNQDDYDAIFRAFRYSTDHNIHIEWIKSSDKAILHLNKIDQAKKEEIIAFPSVIILDLNMPGIDGREMLGIIRGMEKLKIIPVIILTTSDDHNDIKKCYEVGATSYIQKPVSFEKLKEICQNIERYWFETVILPNKL